MNAWTLFVFFSAFFQWSTASNDNDIEVCYDDLGCFSTEKPWSSQGIIAYLPDHPDDINTTFVLHTRRDPYNELVKIVPGDVKSLLNSHFDGSKPTIFIIHGYHDHFANDRWLKKMAMNFLQVQDANVFAVDWRNGARKIRYGKAVANIRVVAAEIVKMIKFLSHYTGLTNQQIHLVGHSLGAHAAGYVGTELKGIGRITGMDPAGPYFHNMDPLVRLDESDAQFVDILHTDSSNSYGEFVLQARLGIWQPLGHVDVYVSGGMRQPGCGEVGPIEAWKGDDIEKVISYMFICEHNRAFEITMESIQSKCPFRAYSCKDWIEFKTGRCLHCPSDRLNKTCNAVGLKAIKPDDASVNNRYYMATGPKTPFCRYHCHVQLKLSTKSNHQQMGKLWFRLVGTKGTQDFFGVNDDEKMLLKSGSTYDFLVTSPEDLGEEIKAVEMKWEHDAAWYDVTQWYWFSEPSIYPYKVTAFSGEHQTMSVFCVHDKEQPLQSKESRNFSLTC